MLQSGTDGNGASTTTAKGDGNGIVQAPREDGARGPETSAKNILLPRTEALASQVTGRQAGLYQLVAWPPCCTRAYSIGRHPPALISRIVNS